MVLIVWSSCQICTCIPSCEHTRTVTYRLKFCKYTVYMYFLLMIWNVLQCFIFSVESQSEVVSLPKEKVKFYLRNFRDGRSMLWSITAELGALRSAAARQPGDWLRLLENWSKRGTNRNFSLRPTRIPTKPPALPWSTSPDKSGKFKIPKIYEVNISSCTWMFM